jgi:hypothetical protein
VKLGGWISSSAIFDDGDLWSGQETKGSESAFKLRDDVGKGHGSLVVAWWWPAGA